LPRSSGRRERSGYVVTKHKYIIVGIPSDDHWKFRPPRFIRRPTAKRVRLKSR
jgi:hypothetical protein